MNLRNGCTHSRTYFCLHAWRTKAPEKGKDVVKKTSGERAGDAVRLSDRRRLHKPRWEKLTNCYGFSISINLEPIDNFKNFKQL